MNLIEKVIYEVKNDWRMLMMGKMNIHFNNPINCRQVYNVTRTKVVVNVNNLKNGRKPVKLRKESPAGCAEEGK